MQKSVVLGLLILKTGLYLCYKFHSWKKYSTILKRPFR